MFEVKRLYIGQRGAEKKILFGHKQLKHLQELKTVDILVFLEDSLEPITVIPSKIINEGLSKWNGITLCGWNTTKTRFDITVDKKLTDWVDEKVKERKFANRSHAVDVALMELKKKDTVKL